MRDGSSGELGTETTKEAKALVSSFGKEEVTAFDSNPLIIKL